MKTIDKIITQSNKTGRQNKGIKPTDKKIYNCKVSLNKEGYDRGGAYWGVGKGLKVAYTKDLNYIYFYR